MRYLCMTILLLALTLPVAPLYADILDDEVVVGHMYRDPVQPSVDDITLSRARLDETIFGGMMSYDDYINAIHGFAGVVCGSMLGFLFIKNL